MSLEEPTSNLPWHGPPQGCICILEFLVPAQRNAGASESARLELRTLSLVAAEPHDGVPIRSSRSGAVFLGAPIDRLYRSPRVGHLWPFDLIVPTGLHFRPAVAFQLLKKSIDPPVA